MLAFGGTATLPALLGMLQARTIPRPLRAVAWLRTHHELSVRYLVENVNSSGASQVRSFVLGGALAGVAAVGYVRASKILMGSFLVVLMGISQVAVPEASRMLHRNSEHLALLLRSRRCSGRGGDRVGTHPDDGLPTRPRAHE
jgi:O-antigen/teichoic acid export membrane protein